MTASQGQYVILEFEVLSHDTSGPSWIERFSWLKQECETQRPHPEAPASAGLEGRSSARHPSFEARRCRAPQDEVEKSEHAGV